MAQDENLESREDRVWNPDDRLLTVSEVGRILKLKNSTIYHMLVRDEIPGFIHIGRSRRISVAALRAFVFGESKDTNGSKDATV